MPGGLRSMGFFWTTTTRLPGAARLGGLCLAGLLTVAGCSGNEQQAALEQQAAPPTPEELRVLHQRGLKARDREIYEVALSYFVEASDGGYGPSSVAAGKLFAAGPEGVPRDDAQAAQRYLLAVEQDAGYRAELPLGVLYLEGRGVAQDAGEADRWFRRGALTIAALEGVVKEGEAAEAEGGARQLIASLFHPHAVPAAFDEALDWARALQTWDGALLFEVSEQYGGTGDGIADSVLAEALLERAAAKGHPEAAYRLARSKLDGVGAARDEAAGLDMLWRAAQGDLVVAQTELAEIYAEADRDPLDRQRAYYWLVRAQRNGAEVSEAVDDMAAALTEAQRKDVLQTLEQGEAYLP